MSSERQILKRLLENVNDTENPTDLDEKTYTVGDTQYWKRGGKCYSWTSSGGRQECSEEDYYKAISGGGDGGSPSPKESEPKTEPKEDKPYEHSEDLKKLLTQVKGSDDSRFAVTSSDIKKFRPTEKDMNKLNKIMDKIKSSDYPQGTVDRYRDTITKMVKDNVKDKPDEDTLSPEDGELIQKMIDYEKKKAQGDKQNKTRDAKTTKGSVSDTPTKNDNRSKESNALDLEAEKTFQPIGGPGGENPAMDRWKEIKDDKEKARFLKAYKAYGDSDYSPRLERSYTDYLSTGDTKALKDLEDQLN